MSAGTKNNPAALRALRGLLDAAHDFELDIAGVAVSVRCETLPTPSWPGELDDLDQDDDGPWPIPVVAHATWDGGTLDFVLQAAVWKTNDQYRLVLR